MKCQICFNEIEGDRKECDPRLIWDIKKFKGHKDMEFTLCQECATKTVRDILFDRYKKLLGPLYDDLNSTSNDALGIRSDAFADAFCCEHRQLQQYLIEFIMVILKKLGQRSGDPNWVDGRNEHGFRYLKKLSEVDPYGG